MAPPALLASYRVVFCGVVVAGESMADQEGIGFFAIECAIATIGNIKAGQDFTTIQPQALRKMRGASMGAMHIAL